MRSEYHSSRILDLSLREIAKHHYLVVRAVGEVSRKARKGHSKLIPGALSISSPSHQFTYFDSTISVLWLALTGRQYKVDCVPNNIRMLPLCTQNILYKAKTTMKLLSLRNHFLPRGCLEDYWFRSGHDVTLDCAGLKFWVYNCLCFILLETDMSNVTWTDIGLILLAILLPPLAVFVKEEEFNKGIVDLNTCVMHIHVHCPCTITADYEGVVSFCVTLPPEAYNLSAFLRAFW